MLWLQKIQYLLKAWLLMLKRHLTASSPGGRDAGASLFTFMHWRRKWQPTPVFFPGESQGRQSLVGYPPPHTAESLNLDLEGISFLEESKEIPFPC